MKNAEKTLLKAARAVRHSKALKDLVALPGGALYLDYRRRYGNRLTFNISTKIGMGAILAFATRIYAWAEDEGCEVHVRSTSPLYSDGEDLFSTYFAHDSESEATPEMPSLAQEWFFRRILRERLDLGRASKIASKHFRPSASLEDEIGRVRPVPRHRVAIHYRGTDKVREGASVNVDSFLDLIESVVSHRGNEQIFLATDDVPFEIELRKRLPQSHYWKYELNQIAVGRPRHFAEVPPREKAMEALVNIFLISEADICIRTCSFMSAFSKIVNPGLETLTVNRLSAGDHRFPDFELLADEKRSR